MEFHLCSLEGALPIEITIDEDNGRYLIRKADTSGEVFNSAQQLIHWVQENFSNEEFCDPHELKRVLESMNNYVNSTTE